MTFNYEEYAKNRCAELTNQPAVEIDEERWGDMLNCLPPCRWQNYNGVNAFHISEMLTGNIAGWLARKEVDGVIRYAEFNHYTNATADQIAAKFQEAMA